MKSCALSQLLFFFFFQAEDGIRDDLVTGVQTCALPICAECDRLIVALNTDRGVRRLKGPERPVNGLEDRSAVIAAVESVDAVISFDEETAIELIRRLKPDVLVKGGDYTVEGVVGHEDVQAAGGRVLLVDLVEGRSTTRLIEAIRKTPATARTRLARARSKEDAA